MERQDAQVTYWALFMSLLQRTRDTTRAAPKYFLTWSAIFYVPVIVFVVLDPIGDPWPTRAAIAALYAAALLLNGATAMYGVQEVRIGSTPTFSAGLQEIKPRMATLAVTAAIACVLQFIGSLLVIPGALFFTWIVFGGPIALEEGAKGWQVIERGRRFVADYRWTQIAGVMVAAFAVKWFLDYIPYYIDGLFHMFSDEPPAFLGYITLAIRSAINVVVTALLSVWIVIAYFDIKGLLESLGIDAADEAAGLQLPKLSISAAAGYIPFKKIVDLPAGRTILKRAFELLLLSVIGLLVWYIFQPHDPWERPPKTLVFSNQKMSSQPPKVEGHIQNNTGRNIKKATWVVKLPAGMKGVPPSIVIVNLKNGDGRDYSVNLPQQMDNLPEIKPFKIEWAD